MMLLLAWSYCGTCRAEMGDLWRTVFPNGGSLGSRDIIWTGSHYVAVGSFGRLNSGGAMTSLDGKVWTLRPGPIAEDGMAGICQAGDKLYACGSNGGVHVSTDGGVTWTLVAHVPASYLLGIAHTGTAIVVVGSVGELLVSYDEGVTWVPRTVATTSLNRVIWTGAELVIVGNNRKIFRSDDQGVTWQPATIPEIVSSDFDFIHALPGGGLLASGGSSRVILSYDGGRTWTERVGSPTAPFRCVFPVAGGLVAFAENGSVHRAATLNSDWQTVSPGGNHSVLGGVVHGDSVITVGSGTILEYQVSTGKVTERTPWTKKNILNSRLIRGNVWVVGSDGDVLLSKNGGQHWEHCSRPLEGSGINIAETATGVMGTSFHGVYVSDDEGATWELKVIEPGRFFRASAAVGETWLVAGDSGRIYRSPDRGATWTYYQHPTNESFANVEVRGSRAVAVSDGGAILTSDDAGVTWTPRTSPVTALLRCVFPVSDSIWLAGGHDGVMLLSSDGGNTWSRSTVPSLGSSHKVVGFCKTPTALIAAVDDANSSLYEPRRVMHSTDSGITWTWVPTFARSRLNTVVWTGSEALLMGDNGVQLKAPASGFPWTSVNADSDGQFTDVVRAGDSLFAVGKTGLLAESTDHGISWAIRDSGTTEDLRAITWTGSSLIVLTQASKEVRRSTDRGVHWTANNSLPTSYNDVVSGNGLVILTGTNSRISVNDGVTWTAPAAGAIPGLGKTDWANGYFYSVGPFGNLLRSPTGSASWSAIVNSSPQWRITAMGSQLFGAIFANGMVGTSIDSGVTWQSRQAKNAGIKFQNVEWTGRRLVATTMDGEIVISGEEYTGDYLAWAAAAGVHGPAALPNVMREDGLTNLFVYAWDHDRDGALSAAERGLMPKMTRGEGAGAHVLSFLLPPADRDDLLVGLEKMQADGSWKRLATKDGARAWQGSPVPVVITQADQFRRVEVAVDPAVEARAFYRLAFEMR